MKKSVLVGMSGGVDSSVTAAILKEAGYEVIGVSMTIWDSSDSLNKSSRRKHSCYGSGENMDIDDARKTAGILEIPFFSIDLRKEYNEHVISYFTREYLYGRTPNPCLICNHKIKFGYLLKKARDFGIKFDYFATGHYAIKYFDGTYRRFGLRKAADKEKDQSYFLSFLEQHQLEMTLFPLGTYKKSEVKKLAKDYKLPVTEKPESQDFVENGDYSVLFKERPEPGPIVDFEGNIRGMHKGIIYYTIGQRRRLGISNRTPLYVLKIDKEKNAITVGPREKLYHSELIAKNINWILIPELDKTITAKAKIRFAHREADANLFPLDKGRVKVSFKTPQMSPTPGQAVVFYIDDYVLGGGIIE